MDNKNKLEKTSFGLENKHMLELRNLSRSFLGRKVLDDLTISFPSTGLFILEGENGSGKSTLLDILDLLDKDYEGSVLYNGKEIKEYKSKEIDEIHRNQIVYVTQKDSFLSIFNKRENETLKPYWKKEKTKNQTSSGERMLSVLKRALVPGKKIYLLDEVSANLDEEHTKKLIEDIVKLSKESLVILVSHDSRVSKLDCAILTLEKGKLKVKKDTKQIPTDSKKLSVEKSSPSKTLLFKAALKSQLALSILLFFLFFFAFLMLEGPVAFSTYDFKLGINQFVKSGDIVHMTGPERAMYKEESKEGNFVSDGLLIFDKQIPNDNKIHISGRQSLLFEGSLKSNNYFSTRYYTFKLPEVIIDDSTSFDGYFVNPGFKESWMTSENLINGITAPDVSFSVDGNSFKDDFVFATIDSLKSSVINRYKQFSFKLPSDFTLQNDEILFSNPELRNKKVVFDSYPADLAQSIDFIYPDLGSIIGDKYKSVEVDITPDEDLKLAIVSNNTMNKILDSTKDDWIESLYLNVTDSNVNYYRDYIYSFLSKNNTKKQGDLSNVIKLIKRKDQLIVSAMDEYIANYSRFNPYDPYMQGLNNRKSFFTNKLLVELILVPTGILLLCLGMTYSYFFKNNRRKIRVCYSLGWSKISIFLAYSLPSALALVSAYIICFYLSLLSWGLAHFNAWGFGYIPQFQWSMILIMLAYILGVAILQLVYYLKVFKKK